MENEEFPWFLVLDGGLATELVRAGFHIDGDPLWSARILVESPEAIKTVHKSFLESGANVLITATYQASIEGLFQYCGLDQNEALAVIHKSVKIAQDACNYEVCSTNTRSQRRSLVAGSVGPYGACQHDGSEYTGNYVDSMTIQELMDWHRPRVEALLQAGVDILALETIPAQKEAEALVQLLTEFPAAKAWLAMSCRDGSHTCHGELFSDVVSKIVNQSTQVVAVGVNCTSPLFVKSLLQSMKGKVELPFVVYPNSGEDWKDGKWDCTGAVQLHSFVEEWIEAGARWIGVNGLKIPHHCSRRVEDGSPRRCGLVGLGAYSGWGEIINAHMPTSLADLTSQSHNVVVTYESVDEIIQCDHSSESYMY